LRLLLGVEQEPFVAGIVFPAFQQTLCDHRVKLGARDAVRFNCVGQPVVLKPPADLLVEKPEL
jgi:hypothetical protein